MVEEISLGNINPISSTTLKRMLTKHQLDRDEHKHSLQVDEPDEKEFRFFNDQIFIMFFSTIVY